MFLVNWFQESVLSETLMILFLVAFIGYLVGSITIRGVELGTAGVLLVALVFGHFIGDNADLVEGLGMFRDLGLICFVTSVGFIAGPKFFRNFKINAKSYILLGFIIIAIGALTTVGIIEIAGVPSDITVGMMSGALTSTPGLAAALDATGSANASVGYGIAYPFGVIGVVLFVQLVPKILKTDMAAERAKFEAAQNVGDDALKQKKKLFQVDAMGFFPFALAIALGIVLAKIVIPLPGGAQFSLGFRWSADRRPDTRPFRTCREDQLPCREICAGVLKRIRSGAVPYRSRCGGWSRIYRDPEGAGTCALPLRSADHTDPDDRRIFCGDQADEAEPVQYAWLYLRRYDKYAGPRYADQCDRNRRRCVRLCGNLPRRAGICGAGVPVYRNIPVKDGAGFPALKKYNNLKMEGVGFHA